MVAQTSLDAATQLTVSATEGDRLKSRAGAPEIDADGQRVGLESSAVGATGMMQQQREEASWLKTKRRQTRAVQV